MHQRDAVATLRLIHEMGGDEDRHLLLAREADQMAPEHVARRRVHSRCRLVQNEDLGLVQTGGGQLQPLPDAQRQSGGQGLGLLSSENSSRARATKAPA
jgi:hypothetical protein